MQLVEGDQPPVGFELGRADCRRRIRQLGWADCGAVGIGKISEVAAIEMRMCCAKVVLQHWQHDMPST